MPTTTVEAIRDSFETSIQALTPGSLTDHPFRVAEDMIPDFREWCEAHPDLRRFTFRRVGEVELPEISDGQIEYQEALLELIVCYPNQMALYGDENVRDLGDLTDTDKEQINSEIGHRGSANYPAGLDASRATESLIPERGENVSYLSMVFHLQYKRDVS